MAETFDALHFPVIINRLGLYYSCVIPSAAKQKISDNSSLAFV